MAWSYQTIGYSDNYCLLIKPTMCVNLARILWGKQSSLGTAEADPGGLIGGEEWGYPGRRSGRELGPPENEKNFSLEVACFGEFCEVFF